MRRCVRGARQIAPTRTYLPMRPLYNALLLLHLPALRVALPAVGSAITATVYDFTSLLTCGQGSVSGTASFPLQSDLGSLKCEPQLALPLSCKDMQLISAHILKTVCSQLPYLAAKDTTLRHIWRYMVNLHHFKIAMCCILLLGQTSKSWLETTGW